MEVTIKLTSLSAGAYRAWCPSLPGCVAYGHSPEEARRRLHDAIEGYLASMDVAVPPRVDEQQVAA